MVGMKSCGLCLGLVIWGSASSQPTWPDMRLSEPRLVGKTGSSVLDSFCLCIFFGHSSCLFHREVILNTLVYCWTCVFMSRLCSQESQVGETLWIGLLRAERWLCKDLNVIRYHNLFRQTNRIFLSICDPLWYWEGTDLQTVPDFQMNCSTNIKDSLIIVAN